jgi:Protein of unknown function (DUF664)
MVSVPPDDFLWFVDDALAQMAAVLGELGDVGANRRPELPGANSAFAIATHCLGVMEFWGGVMVAERPVERDRKAEFRAEGRVEDLLIRLDVGAVQLRRDMAGTDPLTASPDVLGPGDAGRPYGSTKGAVLLHVMEELYQHLGQMELTRDILLADPIREVPVVCTLGADDLGVRRKEWQALRQTMITDVEQRPDQLRLGLAPGADALGAAVDLAQREKACCTFFEFELDLQADQRWLVVRVPPDATEALAAFGEMLGTA